MPTFRQDPKLGTMVPLMKTDDYNDQSVTEKKLKDGNITTRKLADGSVSNEKLADGSVSNEKLADGSVTNEKIAVSSITKDKLKDNTIGVEKLDPELRQTINAATGLPENLVETIQNVDETLKEHQSQLDDKQSQIDDKQQQITANDEDISLLQTRSTQMEETIKGIAATGGASQATAVTYDNEKSGLTALNAQAAIDETNTKLSDLLAFTKIPNAKKCYNLITLDAVDYYYAKGRSTVPVTFESFYIQVYKRYSSSNVLRIIHKDQTESFKTIKDLSLSNIDGNNYLVGGYVKTMPDWAYIQVLGIHSLDKEFVNWENENEYCVLPSQQIRIEKATGVHEYASINIPGERKKGHLIYGLNSTPVAVNDNEDYRHYVIDAENYDSVFIKTLYAGSHQIIKQYGANGEEMYEESIYDSSQYVAPFIVKIHPNAKTIVLNLMASKDSFRLIEKDYLSKSVDTRIVQESGNSTGQIMSQAAVAKSMIVPNSYKLLSLGKEQNDISNIPDWFMRSQVYPCVFDGIYIQVYKLSIGSKVLYVKKKNGTSQLFASEELGLLRNGYISYGYIKFKEDWAYIKPFGVDYVQTSTVGWDKNNEYVKLPQINRNIETASKEILEVAEPYVGESKEGFVIFGLDDDVITQNGTYYHYEINCTNIDKFVVQKKNDSTFNAIMLKFFDIDKNELFEDSIYDASCFTGAAVINVPAKATTAIFNYDTTVTLQVVKESFEYVFVNSVNDLTAETSKNKKLILVKDINITKETVIAEGATIVFGSHHLIITISSTKSLCSPATDKDSLSKIITLDYDRDINSRPIYRTAGSYVNILSGLFKTRDNKVFLADFSYDKKGNDYNHFIPLFENFIECDFVIDRPMNNKGYIYEGYDGNPSSITRPVTNLCGLSDKCTLTFTENGFLGEDVEERESYEGYQYTVLPITGSIIIRNGKFGRMTLAICNPASLDQMKVQFDNCYFNAACVIAGPCYNNDGSGISVDVTNCKFSKEVSCIACLSINNSRVLNNTFIDCARPINGTFANSEFAYNYFENNKENYPMVTGMIFGGAMFGTPSALATMTVDAARNADYFGCELFNCNIHNNVFRDVTEEAISFDSNKLFSTNENTLSRNQSDICQNRNLMVLDEVISEEYNGVYPHTRYQCARVHFVYEDKFIEQYDKHFSFIPLGKNYFGKHTFIKKISVDSEDEGKFLIYSEDDQFFQGFKAGELFAVCRCHVNNWIHDNIFYSPESASVCIYNFGIDDIIENNEIYCSSSLQQIWAQAYFNARYNKDGELIQVVKRILVQPIIGQVIRNNVYHTKGVIRLTSLGTSVASTKPISEDYPIYQDDGADKDYDITDSPMVNCVIEGNHNVEIIDEIAKGTYISNNINCLIRTSKPAINTHISGNVSYSLYLMGNEQYVYLIDATQLKQWSQSESNTPTFKKGSTKMNEGKILYFNGTEWV
jgi:hypothetical protein